LLNPESAHGTNPASAQMVGYKVVVINCDDNGDIDMSDLETKASEHGNNIAAHDDYLSIHTWCI